jgi:hypothetical protein
MGGHIARNGAMGNFTGSGSLLGDSGPAQGHPSWTKWNCGSEARITGGRESDSHTIAGELNPKMEAAAAGEVDEGKMRWGTGSTRGLKITVRGCVVSHYNRSLTQHRHDRHVVFVIAGSFMLASYIMAGSGIVLSTNSILPSLSKWWSV